MIEVTCGNCGHLHKVLEKYAGVRGRCNKCGNAMCIPEINNVSAAKNDKKGILAITLEGKCVALCDDNTWHSTTLGEHYRQSGGGRFNFRRTTWGMSKEQVMASEKLTPVDDQEILAYEVSIGRLDFYLIYSFFNDSLVQGSYGSIQSHSTDQQYIFDYHYLKDLLVLKYGEQTNEEEHSWINDLYMDDYSMWGLAVSLGHMNLKSMWEDNETAILLLLSGDNGEITLSVTYMSIRHREIRSGMDKITIFNDI